MQCRSSLKGVGAAESPSSTDWKIPSGSSWSSSLTGKYPSVPDHYLQPTGKYPLVVPDHHRHWLENTHWSLFIIGILIFIAVIIVKIKKEAKTRLKIEFKIVWKSVWLWMTWPPRIWLQTECVTLVFWDSRGFDIISVLPTSQFMIHASNNHHSTSVFGWTW